MTETGPLTLRTLMAQSGVAFGTSGARGLASALTDRVAHGCVQGFLQYLREIGEFAPGTEVALAGDLRPSTPRILRACAQAVRDAGGRALFCGHVPTPALAHYAFGRAIPSLMVTGSHIPDDRNGIKFHRPGGEILKPDEEGMARQALAPDPARFDPDGGLAEAAPLPEPMDIEDGYLRRYLDFFGKDALSGLRLGLYQHSAVGRDLIARILRALGAEVLPLGRSDRFIPVDTEALRPEDIALARDWAAGQRLDAIVSTDGDSDRPLLADHRGEWLRGDLLGLLCARELGAECVVTPVSSNTALELSGAFARTIRTRIGSPYVIAAMSEAACETLGPVCGYEANGGFLLGSEIVRDGRRLAALPTRDAVLPVVAVLAAARARPLAELCAGLPRRVTFSDRLQDFPTRDSQAILAWLTAGSEAESRARIEAQFGPLAGGLWRIDQTDGLRMTFADGAIIHLRPSGNAPELRLYTEAGTDEAARTLNAAALAQVRGMAALLA
ncbi:phosphomannomutase [Paracoccus pantotrophus]|uniref:Phosphomannomutase n=1 Tax=Paracoccus pantotrophus TaxID=82367 RepID=A0AAE6TTD4_PARPN|nr:phosphomannomutase [Paracoccus pantotrophus]QFG36524.1 phosphomannomutase [Paracoccus pantotrophus]RDD98779.1 phosphomannomutase [Paracoccus pantotrophus]RKS42884.1 phosphomannomutase [Paracoccus pantotrophus]WGR65984.1 phosphomannomutase [Paracoccus pantotrophus]